MTNDMWWEFPLKKAKPSVYAICTGGGAELVEMLFRPPGASAYLSGASFPYSSHELDELLGFTPRRACSLETATDLACVAYMRAFGNGQKDAIGLGLTATVATDRPHRGGERVHACVVGRRGAFSVSMKFGPELRVGSDLALEPIPGPRIGQELRLEDSAKCCRIGMKLILRYLEVLENKSEIVFLHRSVPIESADALVLSRFLEHPVFMADGKRLKLDSYTPDALFPGSFNPPHAGHFGLAKEVERVFGKEVAFHLTIDPPSGHKHPLGLCDVLERVYLLRGHTRIVTREDPLFIDKARKFPGASFVMGVDAAVSFLDPKWGVPVESMLAELSELGTKFYVGGRTLDDSRFLIMSDVNLPREYRSMFIPVDYRMDISSTKVREENNVGV